MENTSKVLTTPRASIPAHLQPARLDLIRRNVTQVGINAAATGAGRFLHPKPPCVDPGPHYLYSHAILAEYPADRDPQMTRYMPINLIPKFGERADPHLTAAKSVENSREFFLNHYFDMEDFFHLHGSL